MRPTLAFLILCALVASAATRAPAAAQAAITLDPQTATPTGEREMGTTEIDLVKWGFTQGGLTLVLIVVLASYRRDFFRKQDAKQNEVDGLREEKRMLASVIDKNADAMLRQAVSVNANTEATKLLAQNVNNLAERRGRG